MGFKGVVPASDYTFNASAKTVTFSANYSTLALSDILYILNAKSGTATVIYDPTDAAKGGTYAGRTLTLAHNTTSMSNSDPLQIIVAEGDVGSAINDLSVTMRGLLNTIANPSYVVNGRAEVTANIPSTTFIQTVATLNNILAINSMPADMLLAFPAIQNNYELAIRERVV